MSLKSIITTALVLATALIIVLGWQPSTAASRKILYRLAPTDSLYSSWTFDPNKVSGTSLTDDGSGNNGGTLVGSPTFVSGVVGRAMRLNGTTDFANITNFSEAQPDPFTLMAWFRTSVKSSTQYIVYNQFTAGLEQRAFSTIYINTSGYGNFMMQQESNPWASNVAANSVDLSDGEWHQLTGTFDDSSLRLHVDGVLVATAPKTLTLPSAFGFRSGLVIGAQGNACSGNGCITSGQNFFQGDVDDVKMYSRVLDAAEIYSYVSSHLPNKRGRISPVTKPTATVLANVSHVGRFTSGLVRHYTFDGPDTSGTTVTDRGSAGSNATLSGTKTTPGIIGQAMNFDGVNDYGSFTAIDDPNGTSLSIEAWVRPTAIGGVYVITGADEGNPILMCRINAAGTAFMWARGSNGLDAQAAGTTAMTANNWYHIACTWNTSGKVATVYLNGVNEGSSTNSSIVNVPSGLTHMGVASRSGSPFESYFKGDIDELRIYNRVLTATEVAEHYKAGRKD